MRRNDDNVPRSNGAAHSAQNPLAAGTRPDDLMDNGAVRGKGLGRLQRAARDQHALGFQELSRRRELNSAAPQLKKDAVYLV